MTKQIIKKYTCIFIDKEYREVEVVKNCEELSEDHTVILPDYTLEKRALSCFKFQRFWQLIGTQNKKNF